MKKHLLAAAAAGATALLAAGSAAATDLTVYGLLDTGLNFRSVDADNSAVWSALDGERLTMDSGMTLGSRFGFKAVESMTPSVNVGFVLEDGFDSDTGSMMTGRIFGRESQMYLEGTYGKLSFGRVAVLMSNLGSFGLMGELSALSTGYGDAGNHAMVFASFDTRRDNVVTYVSPTYAGLTLHAQYAMGNSNENKSSAEGGRYGALALTYSNDALHIILHVDRLNKNHEERNGNDMVTVTGGVSYKFEPLTLYVGGQYFNNANEVGSSSYGYKLGGLETSRPLLKVRMRLKSSSLPALTKPLKRLTSARNASFLMPKASANSSRVLNFFTVPISSGSFTKDGLIALTIASSQTAIG